MKIKDALDITDRRIETAKDMALTVSAKSDIVLVTCIVDLANAVHTLRKIVEWQIGPIGIQARMPE